MRISIHFQFAQLTGNAEVNHIECVHNGQEYTCYISRIKNKKRKPFEFRSYVYTYRSQWYNFESIHCSRCRKRVAWKKFKVPNI